MGRNAQPVDLLVAKGKNHRSKAEMAERKARELKVDLTDIEAPDYLPEDLRPKFWDIATKLRHIGIMTELDVDVLARYLLAESNYLMLTALLAQAISRGAVDDIGRIQRSQNASFGQCQSCASALGLTITSRCKLVVPEVQVAKENKFSKFEK